MGPAVVVAVGATVAMAAAATTATAIFDGPLDHLDASLEDFEPSITSIRSPHQAAFGYPSVHSGFRSDSELEENSDSEASAGGYSPPAWRRLGNGDHSSGFWRKSDGMSGGLGGGGYDFDDEAMMMLSSRESSPEYESADEGEQILAQAVRTRLPGSMSPEKERSPEPEYYAAQQYLTETVKMKREKMDLDTQRNRPSKNCRIPMHSV